MPVNWSVALIALMAITAEPEVIATDTETKPDMSFIEYLGRWETSSGKMVDPTQLETTDTNSDTQKKEPTNEE